MTTTDARAERLRAALEKLLDVTFDAREATAEFDRLNDAYFLDPENRAGFDAWLRERTAAAIDEARAALAVMEEVLDHDAPLYTTDPSDDYEVLRHVRETWDGGKQYQFANALAELYRTRNEGNHPILRYLPGDYSRAALAVMEGE